MNGRYTLATISLENMAGGLERNITALANWLSQNGHQVNLITFDQKSAQSFYQIEKDVQWFKIGLSQPHAPIGFFLRLRLIFNIRLALKKSKSSVIVCFHHGILLRFFLAALFLKNKIVVSERNSLTLYDYVKKSKWNINFMLMSLVDKVVVQFPRYILDYPLLLRKRIFVIPNSVVQPDKKIIYSEKKNMSDRFEILAVGRLCAQKNYDVLIDAYSNLAFSHPHWNLTIIGDGEKYDHIMDKIDKYGLKNRISLLPSTTSIFDSYIHASLFCIPSQWEGFPNALAEALAHGLPSVGLSDCAGVNNLIIHGENGLLASGIDGPNSLSFSLNILIKDSSLRKKMAESAWKSMRKFRSDRIFPQWEALLQ